MAHTRTWDAANEASPANSDNVGDGAGKIRDLKVDIRERMAKDHYMAIAGTDADHGEHSQVTFQAPISTPAGVANKGFVYGKDVGSKIELHWENEDSKEIQLTRGEAVCLGNCKALSDGATIAIDWKDGATQYVTLAGTGRTITFSNPTEGMVYRIILIQDATGSRTVTTWPTIKWRGGAAPTLTTTGAKADIVTLLYCNSTYYGDCSNNF